MVEVTAGPNRAKLGWYTNSSGNWIENDGTSFNLLVSNPNGQGVRSIPGAVEIGITSRSAFGVAVSADLVCVRSQEHLTMWRFRTWSAINAAYRARLEAWETAQTLAAATGRSFGDNPALNRFAERRELKSAVVSMMTQQDFSGYGKARIPGTDGLSDIAHTEARAQSGPITFFEDVFDWENLSFRLFDYAWAGRAHWEDMAARSSTDPEHQEFLRAGAAKVTVPVREGAEITALNYFAKGAIWEEDEALAEEAFPSIVEQLNALSEEGGEGKDEKPFTLETLRVPTNLVILQQGPNPNDTSDGWVGPIQLPPASADAG